jgi:hypothetical protein
MGKRDVFQFKPVTNPGKSRHDPADKAGPGLQAYALPTFCKHKVPLANNASDIALQLMKISLYQLKTALDLTTK